MSDQGNQPTRAERDLRSYGLLALGIGIVLWVFNYGGQSAGMTVTAGLLTAIGVLLLVAWLAVRASKR